MSWDKCFLNRLGALFFAVLFCTQAFAADVRYLTYAGRIVDDSGNPLNGSVQFNIKITNSAGTCVLWEETLTDTLSAGVFGLQIGRGTNVFDGFGSGSIEGIFKQGLVLNCKDATPTANITPLVTDDRNMTVSFNDGTGWQSMANQIPIRSVPYALYAANVANLLGYPIAVTAAPTNGQVLQFQSGSNSWVPTTLSGGSSNIVAGGSAAAPGFSFTGDTNTGIFSPGADQVGISTNGIERLHVDAVGNVGVGTADPANSHGFYNSANRIIGVTGDASASTTAHGVINLANNRATPTSSDMLGKLDFGSVNNSGINTKLGAQVSASLSGAGGANGFGGKLLFFTKPDNGTGVTLRMTIMDTGNVGIGTTSPQSTLDINGYARLKSYSSAPVACIAGNAGALALTSNYTGCTCNGTSWIKLADATACVW